MPFEIKWSEKAETQLYAIFDYLESKWSLNIALNFTTEIDFVLEILCDSPNIGQVYDINNENIRFILIN